MNERQTIDRGWFYVLEPDQGRWAPEDRRILADDGTVLTRRLHGHPARVEVVDRSGAGLAPATLLRAAGAVGRPLEDRGRRGDEVLVVLAPEGTPTARSTAPDGRLQVTLDGPRVAALPSHHPLEAEVAALLEGVEPPARTVAPDPAGLPDRPAPRALFFESLMNTDMPHNDKEISQGVLHMVSPLEDLPTEVVLVNAKMPIEGEHRPVQGLERLVAALETGPIHFIGITLLEGYWQGVRKLIRTIREMGCHAHIAVGGVMPSLAPEHVAAHLDDVSFICRGAGEYFIPRLVELVGDRDARQPFTEAQRAALLAMDGLLVVDRAERPDATGLTLLSCRSSHTQTVADLDRVPLDLSHVQAHHIEGGIEIATSRGCIHKCSFCSILGRESYQARSAGGIFDVLDAYEARFRELHGDRIPPNAYRVHISDDDFACDKARAKAFFEQLLDTPFRLSSVQVAIGDLCRREGGRLLAEPDHELLDAIQARCFADHGRPIPTSDFYEDHKSRNWSSFLQIGVETYSDREIARLGKGYKRVHIRAIVAELARRDIHMDGYFILSNADTTAEDLVDVFSEVARLKLRFPKHFHMRFPVVQHLVSYFTAASHRRHVRRGRRHVMKLRGHAHVPQHTELDYPFVDHDVPDDPIVQDTVAETFVTDRGLYTGNLDVLGEMWRGRLAELAADDPEHPRLQRLIRKVDDRGRRLVFEMLRQAWLADDAGWPDARLDKDLCLDTAERVLGPHDTWFGLLRHVVRIPTERRLVLAPLDADGTPLPDDRLHDVVELLLSSDAEAVALHVLAQPTGTVPATTLGTLRQTLGEATHRRRRHHHKAAAELRVDLDALPDDDPAVLAALVRLTAPERSRPVAPLRVVVRGRPAEVAARLHDAAHDPRLAVLTAEGARIDAVLELSPSEGTDPASLSAALDAAAAVGLTEVRLAPRVGDRSRPASTGFDADTARALAGALFAAAGPLTARTLALHDPTQPRLHPGTTAEDLAVDVAGHIGRADGLDPATGLLRPSHRLGRLERLTNLDRHVLELADPALLPRAPDRTARLKALAPADKVLRSFAGWLQAQRAPSAPTDDGPDARSGGAHP